MSLRTLCLSAAFAAALSAAVPVGATPAVAPAAPAGGFVPVAAHGQAASFALMSQATIALLDERCSEQPWAVKDRLGIAMMAWQQRNGTKVEAADRYTRLVIADIGRRFGADQAAEFRQAILAGIAANAQKTADSAFIDRTPEDACVQLQGLLDGGHFDLEPSASGPALLEMDAIDYPDTAEPTLVDLGAQ